MKSDTRVSKCPVPTICPAGLWLEQPHSNLRIVHSQLSQDAHPKNPEEPNAWKLNALSVIHLGFSQLCVFCTLVCRVALLVHSFHGMSTFTSTTSTMGG